MKYLSSEKLSVVIRTKRKHLCYNQENIARKLGISRKTYAQKEERPLLFTVAELNRLAKHLYTDPAELMAEATREL